MLLFHVKEIYLMITFYWFMTRFMCTILNFDIHIHYTVLTIKVYFSSLIFLPFAHLALTPLSSLLVITTLLSVSTCLSQFGLFIWFVCLFHLFLYATYKWNNKISVFFHLRFILVNIHGPFMLSQMPRFHLFMAKQYSIVCMYVSSLSIHLPVDT